MTRDADGSQTSPGRTLVPEQALEVAREFRGATGFADGMFNMEFFHDASTGKLTVIECNPRMAPQFPDLYLRGDGIGWTAPYADAVLGAALAPGAASGHPNQSLSFPLETSS